MLMIDKGYNKDYDGTRFEKYKQKNRGAALKGASRLNCRVSGYVQPAAWRRLVPAAAG